MYDFDLLGIKSKRPKHKMLNAYIIYLIFKISQKKGDH